MADDFDRHMMSVALTMARRGLGLTAPNPSVGAVLVDSARQEIISRAVTAKGGRPHAEPLAIAIAGGRADGATLYVTLEPCSHHGQTGPCADAIVASGVARVVCGIEDPDPRVAGRGLDRLRAAGIAVERGVLAAEARDITRGHISRVTQRRPFVTLKLALESNGAVPLAEGGKPRFVTSPESQRLGHLLRARSDAILVGSGTVIADDPTLTCRLPGLSHRSPNRVILAAAGLDLAGSRLAATITEAPVLVLCAHELEREPRDRMRAVGVGVETVMTVEGRLWLPAAMEKLAEAGVTRVLVEGGPAIWRAFADAGLADEVVVFLASGGKRPTEAAAQAAAQAAVSHLGPVPLVQKDARAIGPDLLWRAAVRGS